MNRQKEGQSQGRRKQMNCSFMLVFLSFDLTAVSHVQEYFPEGSWPLDCHSNFLAFRKYLRELLCSEPREIQHQKRAKNHRDLSARASLLRTTLISWWDRGHNQLNHLPRLHFSSLYQQMKPRQTAWTWSLQWKQQVEAEQPGVLKDSVFILAG